jgi:RNA polymerase sigma factor (sigma-70 family)
MSTISDTGPSRQLSFADEQARTDFWHKHYPQLKFLVSYKIRGIPPLVGLESDIAHEAMTQFFNGIDDGRFHDTRGPSQIWSLLITIAQRTLNQQRKSLTALKRGGMGTSPEAQATAVPVLWPGVIDNVPDTKACGAHEQAKLRDLLDFLLEQLPDDEMRQIVLHRLEGRTTVEIAELLGISNRRVQRLLREIKRRWEPEFLDHPPGT